VSAIERHTKEQEMKIQDFMKMNYAERLDFFRKSSFDEKDALVLQCETPAEYGSIEDVARFFCALGY
jgi:hypothetical protein